MTTADFILAPLAQARESFAARAVTIALLTPPYDAVGEGELRVLRIRESADGALDVMCGFERYRRT